MMGGVSSYTVQAGDTLNKISARFGVPKAVLLAENDLKPNAKLHKNSQLIVNNTHVVPVWMNDGITINLPQRMLYFFQDKHLVSSYPVGLGKPDWPTPTGKFKVANMQMDKDWLVPLSIQEEMRREGHTVITRLPSGPKNPLGRHWLGLSAAGYGIHGTSSPTSIYHFQSHGCIRSNPEDIAVLYQLVSVGTPVNLVYHTTMLAKTADGKLWLEVQPDVYQHGIDALGEVRAMAEKQHLVGKLDWQKVYDVVQQAQGIARDVGLN
ncbi:MAG: L,D-transpeptidase family protein [Sulfuriferula sp.]|nr:L,D-transpeptidase family protein [Sulfuriferula sp.]